MLVVLGLLFGFLVGIGFVEAGIAAMGAGFQSGLLSSVSNPLAGLFVGILATVLVQSSSVTSSAIVGMVGSGTIPVGLAVPMVMGANVGTTVTSTLAALASIRRSDEFRRGFAAASVHDFYNLVSLSLLFPLELATGFLEKGATALTSVVGMIRVDAGGTSVVRTAVRVPISWVQGGLDGVAGRALGPLLVLLGLVCIFAALGLITRRMRVMVAGAMRMAMNHIVGKGGGALGILVGLGITVAVQSSTITTSILVPLVASGVLTLGGAYSITVGANVGTTLTALIASMAVLLPEGLTIALVHFLYNIASVLLVYVFSPLRPVPVRLAEGLAGAAVRKPWIVVVYVAGVFIVMPLIGALLLR